MRVVYAPRAVRDLKQIATYYRTHADDKIAVAVADRIEHVINLVSRQPEIAPRVARRPNVRVVLILRYPYKVFYRARSDVLEILHVRHTSRRAWEGHE